MVRPVIEVEEIAHQAIDLIKNHLEISSAYLFGSYVSGDATSDSDIDLAVFSPSLDEIDIDEKITILAQVQQAIGEEIEIHLFSDQCLKEARKTNFYGFIIENGRRIV